MRLESAIAGEPLKGPAAPLTIAVAGGGIAGLAVATLLLRAGHAVVLACLGYVAGSATTATVSVQSGKSSIALMASMAASLSRVAGTRVPIPVAVTFVSDTM